MIFCRFQEKRDQFSMASARGEGGYDFLWIFTHSFTNLPNLKILLLLVVNTGSILIALPPPEKFSADALANIPIYLFKPQCCTGFVSIHPMSMSHISRLARNLQWWGEGNGAVGAESPADGSNWGSKGGAPSLRKLCIF